MGAKQQKQLDQLQQSLKQQELNISTLEKQIKSTKGDLATANSNIEKLKIKIKDLEAQKEQQADKLEQLLKTYYVTKNANTNGNLLSNDVNEDRISQYFQHLAKARSETILALQQTREELASNERQLQLERDQIVSLLEEQTKKYDKLAKTQSARKGLYRDKSTEGGIESVGGSLESKDLCQTVKCFRDV